jgi:hypothetical protein
MQPEDILRIRESQEIDQLKIQSEQRQLIDQIKQTIRKQTIIPTERYNDVLKQAVDLLKKTGV